MPLSSYPSPTPMAHRLLLSWLLSTLALLVFLQTMTMRHRPTMTRRRRTTSSRLHFIALFPFWCLDDKGEKRVFSISVFHSSVAYNMDKNLLNVWLVIL
jgi:hypothetical protein